MATSLLCLFVPILLVVGARSQPLQTPKTIPRSVYAFGDSFVDTGNNNYIDKRVARSNFPPYGRDFLNGTATGRFSNGLLFPDFLAKYIGAGDYLRSYLDPTLDLHLNETVAAVSFGSATTGYDGATTNQSNAVPMLAQLEYFKQYKAKLQNLKGMEEGEKQIGEAIFYVNAGSDDVAFVFYHDGKAPSGQMRYMPGEYQDRIVNLTDTFVHGLIEEGARKIAVTSLPPLGCIPVGITLLPSAYPQAMPVKRECFEMGNTFSKQFNEKLRNLINRTSSTEVKIGYIDFELPLLEVIQNPDGYGYEEVNKGCCGTGLHEIGFSCNSTTTVCGDTSKYVFWDAAHPTEKTYSFIFSSNVGSIDELIKI